MRIVYTYIKSENMKMFDKILDKIANIFDFFSKSKNLFFFNNKNIFDRNFKDILFLALLHLFNIENIEKHL